MNVLSARFARSLLGFGLFAIAACAHTPITQPSSPNCPQFGGQYLFDPQACRVSRSLLDLSVPFAHFPDASALPHSKALVGVHQNGCDEVSFAVRGLGSDHWLDDRSFAIKLHDDAGTYWRANVLQGVVAERSNLPPPIAIGVKGTYYWRLSRQPDGNLLYVSGYASRGLVTFIPFAAHRQLSCVLARESAGNSGRETSAMPRHR